MAQTAVLLLLPPREHPDDDKDAPRGTTRLLTQSLEDRRLAERVERALCATGYGALRTIRVPGASAGCFLILFEEGPASGGHEPARGGGSSGSGRGATPAGPVPK